MAKFLFISFNDINAHGIRMLSSSLKTTGHESSIIFLKRPGFPYTSHHEKYFTEALKVEAYDWVGIDQNLQNYRYSRGPAITQNEKELLVSLINQINPHIIGMSVTAPLMKRIAKVTTYIKEFIVKGTKQAFALDERKMFKEKTAILKAMAIMSALIGETVDAQNLHAAVDSLGFVRPEPSIELDVLLDLTVPGEVLGHPVAHHLLPVLPIRVEIERRFERHTQGGRRELLEQEPGAAAGFGVVLHDRIGQTPYPADYRNRPVP